jgi:hypothetical protein
LPPFTPMKIPVTEGAALTALALAFPEGGKRR